LTREELRSTHKRGDCINKKTPTCKALAGRNILDKYLGDKNCSLIVLTRFEPSRSDMRDLETLGWMRPNRMDNKVWQFN
jgi:hypothetical protein